MGDPQDKRLEELVGAVVESPKYRAISQELIRRIGRRELAARRSLKEAVKATRNKLHQVAGAYLDGKPEYPAWAEQLAAAAQAGDGELRRASLRIMQHHASTRERAGILETFYAQALAGLPPIRSLLDVACGLNPLARPWMPLAADATYYACDIYADMIAFLNDYFRLAGVRGQAQVCDLAGGPPQQPVDLALVLKALPPLEQLDKRAGLNLLRALNAEYLLVSFPARSLGGRDKGMVEHYASRFLALAEAEGWPVERFEFATELAFRVRKGRARGGPKALPETPPTL
jgi:16S rRNA (guanine(1405)-N(7))-methyltransferase